VGLLVNSGCQTYTPANGWALPTATYGSQAPQPVAPGAGNPVQAIAALPGTTAQAGGPVPQLTPPPSATAPEFPAQPAVRGQSPVNELPTRKQTADGYIADLMVLIDETKSVDAFLITVTLLAEAKPKAETVLPALIRNAERLGIFERHILKQDALEARIVQRLTEIIVQMSKNTPHETPPSPATIPQATESYVPAVSAKVTSVGAQADEYELFQERVVTPAMSNSIISGGQPLRPATRNASSACDLCPPIAPGVPFSGSTPRPIRSPGDASIAK